VGSYENPNWQKKWAKVKRRLELTKIQKELIIGSLLGDGTMRVGKGSINANFKVEQGIVQKDLVFWKYSILRSLVFTEPKISYRYNELRQPYPKSWWFRTVRHPQITDIYHQFYTGDGFRTGRKIIPANISNYINPFTMAIWIMDDGSYGKHNLHLSTYSFSIEEIGLLEKSILECLGISFKHYRDRDKGFRMYCSKTETAKLVPIVKDFILPSLTYKIGYRNPVTTEALCQEGSQLSLNFNYLNTPTPILVQVG